MKCPDSWPLPLCRTKTQISFFSWTDSICWQNIRETFSMNLPPTSPPPPPSLGLSFTNHNYKYSPRRKKKKTTVIFASPISLLCQWTLLKNPKLRQLTNTFVIFNKIINSAHDTGNNNQMISAPEAFHCCGNARLESSCGKGKAL